MPHNEHADADLAAFNAAATMIEEMQWTLLLGEGPPSPCSQSHGLRREMVIRKRVTNQRSISLLVDEMRGVLNAGRDTTSTALCCLEHQCVLLVM